MVEFSTIYEYALVCSVASKSPAPQCMAVSFASREAADYRPILTLCAGVLIINYSAYTKNTAVWSRQYVSVHCVLFP